MYQYLKGVCKEERVRLLSVVSSAKIRGNRYRLEHKRLHLNTRKHFRTVWVTEHWKRLPREAVESPSLEMFRSHLDLVLGTLL